MNELKVSDMNITKSHGALFFVAPITCIYIIKYVVNKRSKSNTSILSALYMIIA
jgi:hypothetical protein